MRVEDIQSYKDLESYILLKLSQREKGVLELEFNEKWFWKLIRLIQFYLKYDEREHYARIKIPEDCDKIQLKINKVFTIVRKK